MLDFSLQIVQCHEFLIFITTRTFTKSLLIKYFIAKCTFNDYFITRITFKKLFAQKENFTEKILLLHTK